MLEKLVEGQLTLINETDVPILPFVTGMDDEEKAKQLQKEDPEYKKIYEESQSQGKAFATKFKIMMFNVLTDAQWARLQKLIDDPPEHAKIFRKKLKEQRGEAEKAVGWQPGPNSWKPGDPIPERYRQEREERITRQRGLFPRSELPSQ
jgi:Ni/Co efflux regulator RcnB